MKYIPAISLIIWLCCTGFALGDGQGASFPQNTPSPKSHISSEKKVKDAGFLQQISYSLGYDIVRHIDSQVDLDMAYFLKGIADARKDRPALSQDQMKQMLMAYQRMARQKVRAESQKVLEKNQAEGAVFLEGNKLKEGVITLSSGLQYKIIEQGDGPVPKQGSTVECHYRGTLLDGTEFDSSYARGRPAVFQVDKVISGWSQALMRMPVGSKWMLYIPFDLAYGERGAGDAIQPGQTLIFEVALLGILD